MKKSFYRDEMSVKKAAEISFYEAFGKDRVLWQNIENKFGRGIPDTFLSCPKWHGWIEFKHAYKWQPRIHKNRMVLPVELRPDQYTWGKQFAANQPNAWALAVGFMDSEKVVVARHSAIIRTTDALERKIGYGVLLEEAVILGRMRVVPEAAPFLEDTVTKAIRGIGLDVPSKAA